MATELKIRLNKYLAQAGLGSRRSVEKYIFSGQVRVNGERITSPGHQVVAGKDSVVFDGNPVFVDTIPTYIMLNKPRGYITTAKDEKNRDTVFHLVHTAARVFPVGRLDRDSEGLLLLTNDGEFANRLLHPRYKVEKTYLVTLNKPAEKGLEQKFRDGVTIDKGVLVHGKLDFGNDPRRRYAVIIIREGKNRQVRKMFARFGLRVTKLVRVQIGPLKLGTLKPGQWRYLSDKELQQLKATTGL
ncbi:MAG TPA: rRNA pseudouridine synthase [Bacteroidetes bacterium]|nr:rRNA pseudouridine synthase [Bacteroidota bacterium]